MRSVLLASSAFGIVLVTACSDDPSRECRAGADCASGMCTAEGLCAAAAASGGPGSEADAAAPGPDASRGDAGITSEASLPGCTPNHDGLITRDEVPIQPGLRATYRVAEDVDVTTAGTPRADGSRLWDYSIALPNDVSLLVETLPLAGKWYQPKYSGASYATRLRASSDLVGVFETAPGSLALRGVVSPADGLYRTELTYQPSVAVLAFPLKSGAAWTSDTTVSGVASGVPVTYSEKFESQIDAHGELVTPLGKFQVLRVRVLLTRTVGLSVTTVRTFAFVTECYGTVATITSKDNEGDVEFTRALEIRRIAP